MSTQITCEDLISLAEKNPNGYLLDVRTELEWKTDGKPDGGKLGLRTFYISYLIDTKEGRIINPNFENELNKLNLDKNNILIVMCKSGMRSKKVAENLDQKGFNTYNVLNGFICSEEAQPNCWKTSGLPILN